MYLFTRTGRFSPGGVRDAMAFVGEVTEKVRQETGLDGNAWTATMSPELGSGVWATFVADLAHPHALSAIQVRLDQRRLRERE